MSTLTLVIVITFVLGYLGIALESSLKVNKAALALLMCVLCWTLFSLAPETFISGFHGLDFLKEAGSATTAMGNLLKEHLTTSIVMVMVLRKLVNDPKDRLIYASLIIIAANSGGAFSPIGDVTTIMLWVGNYITTAGVMKEIFICSLTSMVVPALILQFRLKGELAPAEYATEGDTLDFSHTERKIVFFLGVGGLMFVPVFRYLTDLPPYMGIFLVLSLLWFTTEMFFRSKNHIEDNM